MVPTLRRAVALCGVIGSTTLVLVGGAAADVETGNLPGGAAISVEIAAPADGAVFQLGDSVPVNGAASVAKGVAIQDTTVVFVIDRSGSMGTDAGVDCDGVPLPSGRNTDGTPDADRAQYARSVHHRG